MTKNSIFYIFLLSFFSIGLSAQGLLNELEEMNGAETEYAFATFKGTKVVNLQSVELPGKGDLQYSILHRFGAFNQDFFYNFFGLDNAQIRMTLDYSPTDWLNLGLGHSSFQKVYDAYGKVRLLRQSKGAVELPISMVFYSGIFIDGIRFQEDLSYEFTDRLAYTSELIIARKFNSNFSAEIVPTYTHFNFVEDADWSNDIFAVGLAARYKISKMHAISFEYVHQLNPNEYLDSETNEMTAFNNALSIGFDIETGGHVFQLFLTNSRGTSEPNVFAETPGSWLDGDIHFGFNISRVFTVKKPKIE